MLLRLWHRLYHCSRGLHKWGPLTILGGEKVIIVKPLPGSQTGESLVQLHCEFCKATKDDYFNPVSRIAMDASVYHKR